MTLDVIGAEREQLEAMMLDLDGRYVPTARSTTPRKTARARRPPTCCVAPSLGGESFGMVLTEAFAVGTPVVASDIAGYSDVVSDGVDGVLFPRGDASALAQTPARARRRRASAPGDVGRRGRERAPLRVAARRRPGAERLRGRDRRCRPAATGVRFALPVGARAVDRAPISIQRQRRLPSLERDERTRREKALAALRRFAIATVALAAVAASVLAVEKIGPGRIARALVTSKPSWVVIGFALMCAAMVARGVSWYAILRAALPGRRVRLADAMHGTFIGVLMSATLPARLGEPSRSLIVARRVGRPLETFPVVLGTILSQTLLNLLALAGLGAVMFSSVDLFNGRHSALIAVAVGPAALVAIVLTAPFLIGRRGGASRSERLEGLQARVRATLLRLRAGLRVFRQPRPAAVAVTAQFAAWMLQCTSCYVLLIALGLDDRAGMAAAAGVLFAVNVTAVLPAAPSNIGVFQAACVAVLHGRLPHLDRRRDRLRDRAAGGRGLDGGGDGHPGAAARGHVVARCQAAGNTRGAGHVEGWRRAPALR